MYAFPIVCCEVPSERYLMMPPRDKGSIVGENIQIQLVQNRKSRLENRSIDSTRMICRFGYIVNKVGA